MKLKVKRITSYDEAKIIANWKYDEPYAIYKMDENDSSLRELLDGSYYSATDEEDNLTGYFCFGKSARVAAGEMAGVYHEGGFTDIGLGMAPDLCGRGYGYDFMQAGMHFARKRLSINKFRLTVAAFNVRAIKVYEKLGFIKTGSFKRVSEDRSVEFIVMNLIK